MFMKGEIVEPKKFYVDIGTGYYVVMNEKRALDFYTRKIAFVKDKIEYLVKLRDELLEKGEAQR